MFLDLEEPERIFDDFFCKGKVPGSSLFAQNVAVKYPYVRASIIIIYSNRDDELKRTELLAYEIKEIWAKFDMPEDECAERHFRVYILYNAFLHYYYYIIVIIIITMTIVIIFIVMEHKNGANFLTIKMNELSS